MPYDEEDLDTMFYNAAKSITRIQILESHQTDEEKALALAELEKTNDNDLLEEEDDR